MGERTSRAQGRHRLSGRKSSTRRDRSTRSIRHALVAVVADIPDGVDLLVVGSPFETHSGFFAHRAKHVAV